MKEPHRNKPAPWIAIDQRTEVPFFRQIYERVRNAITGNLLLPGQRLPSVRDLASQLAVARGTVDVAYNLLANEGYIVCRGAAGTVVAPILENLSPLQRQALKVIHKTKSSQRRSTIAPAYVPGPFQVGLPALDAFPRQLWSRMAVRRARNLDAAAMLQPDPFGYGPLREAIASYLALARGVVCSVEQVVITSGFQGALGLLTRVVLKPGDKVWMEDPGYLMCKFALETMGARIVPVPVDDDGMNVSVGIKRSPRARLAIVTPSHHALLGVTLSLSRRLSLLEWANEVGSLIVEDDYDGEFHYDSKPLPALKSLDKTERVIYSGTFSKVLFPGLRLGYLVLPPSWIDPFARTLRNLYGDGATFNQAVVADFIADGHFGRHIRRMRQLYAERRAAVVEAFDETFGDSLSIKLTAGGMHLLAKLDSQERDIVVAKKANAQGLGVTPLSPWCIGLDCQQGLLLGFANIPEVRAKQEVQRLKKAIT